MQKLQNAFHIGKYILVNSPKNGVSAILENSGRMIERHT